MLTGDIMEGAKSAAGQVAQTIGDMAGSNNRSIEEQTERRVRYLAEHPHQIPRRLEEIEREWTTERVLTATAAGLIAIGAALGMTVDRRMFILPAVIAGMMLGHAVVGSSPLGMAFRELGFRSGRDIAREKFALKALRGDFGARESEGSGAMAGYGHGANSDRVRMALEAAGA